MATANWYGSALLGQFSTTAARRVDWVTDSITVTLHTSTYTPNQDTHVFQSDLTNELANGNGYTTGGIVLSSKTTAYDTTSNETRLDAADVTWTFSGGVAKAFQYAVVWSNTAGASTTDPLLGYVNLGAQSVTDTTFTIQWDTTGVLKITAA